jgi:hypothetical protein
VPEGLPNRPGLGEGGVRVDEEFFVGEIKQR